MEIWKPNSPLQNWTSSLLGRHVFEANISALERGVTNLVRKVVCQRTICVNNREIDFYSPLSATSRFVPNFFPIPKVQLYHLATPPFVYDQCCGWVTYTSFANAIRFFIHPWHGLPNNKWASIEQESITGKDITKPKQNGFPTWVEKILLLIITLN